MYQEIPKYTEHDLSMENMTNILTKTSLFSNKASVLIKRFVNNNRENLSSVKKSFSDVSLSYMNLKQGFSVATFGLVDNNTRDKTLVDYDNVMIPVPLGFNTTILDASRQLAKGSDNLMRLLKELITDVNTDTATFINSLDDRKKLYVEKTDHKYQDKHLEIKNIMSSIIDPNVRRDSKLFYDVVGNLKSLRDSRHFITEAFNNFSRKDLIKLRDEIDELDEMLNHLYPSLEDETTFSTARLESLVNKVDILSNLAASASILFFTMKNINDMYLYIGEHIINGLADEDMHLVLVDSLISDEELVKDMDVTKYKKSLADLANIGVDIKNVNYGEITDGIVKKIIITKDQILTLIKTFTTNPTDIDTLAKENKDLETKANGFQLDVKNKTKVIGEWDLSNDIFIRANRLSNEIPNGETLDKMFSDGLDNIKNDNISNVNFDVTNKLDVLITRAEKKPKTVTSYFKKDTDITNSIKTLVILNTLVNKDLITKLSETTVKMIEELSKKQKNKVSKDCKGKDCKTMSDVKKIQDRVASYITLLEKLKGLVELNNDLSKIILKTLN